MWGRGWGGPEMGGLKVGRGIDKWEESGVSWGEGENEWGGSRRVESGLKMEEWRWGEVG